MAAMDNELQKDSLWGRVCSPESNVCMLRMIHYDDDEYNLKLHKIIHMMMMNICVYHYDDDDDDTLCIMS